jgi:hypothetical protein
VALLGVKDVRCVPAVWAISWGGLKTWAAWTHVETPLQTRFRHHCGGNILLNGSCLPRLQSGIKIQGYNTRSGSCNKDAASQ